MPRKSIQIRFVGDVLRLLHLAQLVRVDAFIVAALAHRLLKHGNDTIACFAEFFLSLLNGRAKFVGHRQGFLAVVWLVGRAARENEVRGAFDRHEHGFIVTAVIERGLQNIRRDHEFVLRIERYDVDAWIDSSHLLDFDRALLFAQVIESDVGSIPNQPHVL